MSQRYCEMCDRWWTTTKAECPLCGADLQKPVRKRLTRMERLQAAADAGVDTWEDYREEK